MIFILAAGLYLIIIVWAVHIARKTPLFFRLPRMKVYLAVGLLLYTGLLVCLFTDLPYYLGHRGETRTDVASVATRRPHRIGSSRKSVSFTMGGVGYLCFGALTADDVGGIQPGEPVLVTALPNTRVLLSLSRQRKYMPYYYPPFHNGEEYIEVYSIYVLLWLIVFAFAIVFFCVWISSLFKGKD